MGGADQCVDEETALSFLAGRLSAIEVQRIEEHADQCSSCREFLSALAAANSQPPSKEQVISPVAPTEMGETPSPISSVPLFTRGDAIGRYVVLSQVGVGGMGVVYAAYDPELDRKVAVKLLRKLRGGQEVARARLIREAQALARLTHPNVVAVYDAGAWEDQVFLAMEFVEGGTVGEWLRTVRPWREVLEAFLAAGRGLAAAHARKLVHRDFKPDNVLIGSDGRVVVTDFGLARAVGQEEASERAPSPPPVSPTLTATGAVLGTPGYMAPEQNRGEPADARSDQYSFCVALYEGLHGVRPGQPLPEPRREVPARLQAILERGLAQDPAQRYPSMEALLVDLASDPEARRRRLWGGVGLALVVLLLVGASGLMVQRSVALGRVCLGGPARFDSTLSAERRARLQTLAERARGGDEMAKEAASRWTRLLSLLDGYRRDWIAGYADACEATRIRHDQSEELLNLRMSCLESRLPAVDVLAGLLEKNDPKIMERLVTREVLEPVKPCADRVTLQETVHPPSDPATRAKVDELRSRIRREAALEGAGEYSAAHDFGAPIVDEARAAGYSPALAEALYTRGLVEEHTAEFPAAERDFGEAARVADAARDDLVRAKARTRLVYVVGVREDHPAEGRKLALEADAAVARLGGNGTLERALLDIRASVAEQDSQMDEARALYEKEIALLEKNDPGSLPLGQAENNLGALEQDLHHPDEAIKHFGRAIQIEEAILGPHHPMVLTVMRNRLGTFARPPIDECRELVKRFVAALGPDHPEVAPSYELLSLALLDDPKLRPEAPAAASRALAIYEKTLPPDHDDVVQARGHLGEALLHNHRFEEAERELGKLLPILEARPGARNLYLMVELELHAEALNGLERFAEARRELERVNAYSFEPADVRLKAVTEISLAKALFELHEPTRAKKLAAASIVDYERDTFADDEELASARAWVAAHR